MTDLPRDQHEFAQRLRAIAERLEDHAKHILQPAAYSVPADDRFQLANELLSLEIAAYHGLIPGA